MNIRRPVIGEISRLVGFLAIFGFLLIDPLGFVTGDVFAANSTGNNQGSGNYQDLANTLGMIFVLAVLIEIGLGVLFDWRVFLRLAENKGFKVPIAFAVSLLIVVTHGIDVPGEVIAAFQGKPATAGAVGYVISALIIAGGSSSVNGIFQRLGWRNPVLQAQKAELERNRIKGRLWVKIERPAGGSSSGRPVAVNIDGIAAGVLAPNEDTFGGTGGYAVQQGERTIKITWSDASGTQQVLEEKVVIIAGQTVGKTLTLA